MSSLNAVIFDVDGTLVNSNRLQVEAWLTALKQHGFDVGQDRLEVEIGKGGDQLVEDLLGEQVDRKHGDSLRKAQGEVSFNLIQQKGVKAFARAGELVRVCRSRGLKTAVATSSSKKILGALFDSAGISMDWFDAVVPGDEADATKPQADIYHATLAKLGLSPAQCVNLGDTPYDCIAARRAGLVTLGLTNGFNDIHMLREAGARWTYHDCEQVLANFDEALRRASPHQVQLSKERMQLLMEAALKSAEAGMDAGEVPIGAAIANGRGEIVATGWNRLNATGDHTMHAEIAAFHAAAGRVDLNAKDLILLSTLEPCVMCFGAAMEAGIDTVVYGLPAPFDGGAERVTPPTSPESQMPRIVGGVLVEQSRAMLETWLKKNAETDQAAYVRQLLGAG